MLIKEENTMDIQSIINQILYLDNVIGNKNFIKNPSKEETRINSLIIERDSLLKTLETISS